LGFYAATVTARAIPTIRHSVPYPPSMANARLIIDVSMLIRSSMPATGISRVSYELSYWAIRNRSDARLAAVDLIYGDGDLRILDDQLARELLEKTALIDTFLMPDRGRGDTRVRERLPLQLRYVLMSLQHPRRAAVIRLEHWRQRATNPAVADAIAVVQEWLLTDRYRRELSNPAGGRVRLVGYRDALQTFEPQPGDILLLTGAEWGWTDPALYEELKTRHGVRLVWMCYDIIPLLHPQFFHEFLVRDFRDYAHRLFAIADLVLVSARQVEADLIEYCRKRDLRVPPTRVIHYGANLARLPTGTPRPLPRGLRPGQYAMFVSTIEPRKGHRMLLSVWKRLLAEGIPQAFDFNLVFVGRPGWLMDDLVVELRATDGAANRFHMLSGIGDEELDSLYRSAGFCLYPSIYEGYGLPIVEAFGHGKAVLASDGGALKEVVGDLSPTLDPLDEAAWYVAIKRWIESPQDRLAYEQAIRARYRHPTWDEAAQACFSIIEDALSPP
jgi:glycosyltransferase involved in cell wall biosynthesis